ncbi:MAG: hypothetical protein ACYCXW_21075 [Solirubrobacteraceae bacterium]
MAVLHPQEPFDFQQDRDLVALMNEARSPEQLHDLELTARARLRDRRGARRGHLVSGGHRPALRRLLVPRG